MTAPARGPADAGRPDGRAAARPGEWTHPGPPPSSRGVFHAHRGTSSHSSPTVTTGPAPAIALRDVRKVHGKDDGAVVALDGISIEISPRLVHRDHGPVGVGQEHVPERRGGARPAHLGQRRARRHRAGGAQRAAARRSSARADRVRLPGLQPDALAHGHAEHRPAAAPGRSPPAALGGARGGGAGRAGRPPAPPPLPALRRPAAAGRDRPRARHPARGRVRRRADRRARHRAPGAASSRSCARSSTPTATRS